MRIALCLIATITAFGGNLYAATPIPAKGQVVFGNLGGGVNAPIILPDGRGAGHVPGMVAQLFLLVGSDLLALEPQTPFRSSPPQIPEAAPYLNAVTVTIPGLTSGSEGTFFVRAWESTKGATFEESRSRGGYFGESQPITITVGGGTLPPHNLTPLQGFTLTRWPTLIIQPSASNDLLLRLEGSVEGDYTIEVSTDLIVWTPLENFSSSDTNSIAFAAEVGQKFYRAALESAPPAD
jgi:hypothetical protein